MNTERRRSLYILLSAQVPADFADWLDYVAITALLAYSWQVDPWVFACLALTMGLPYVVVGPFAGVWIDRNNIKSMMIMSNIGRALLTAALFMASYWPMLMVIVALRSTVDTFFTPAKQAAIQSLTDQSNRARVNSVSYGINQASKIIAPAIGGGLLLWFEPSIIFLLNAVVSIMAALLLLLLPNIERLEEPEAEEHSMWQATRLGIDIVKTNRFLRTAIIMMAFGYFSMFLHDTLIAPLARNLGFTQTHLGLSLTAVGAGGVLGVIVMSWLTVMSRPFFWIGLGSIFSGVAVIVLGASEMIPALPISLTSFLIFFAVLGFSTTMSIVPFRTVIQDTVSPQHIGRVTALSEAANTMALLIAPFIGALIASVFSIGAAFVCGGVSLLVIGVWAWSWRQERPASCTDGAYPAD